MTRDECIECAAAVRASGIAEADDRDPRAAAEAAYVPGGPSVEELERRIRRRRGLPTRTEAAS